MAHPAAWACEGRATPEDPLFVMPGAGQHPRQLVVTVVPATARSGAPEYLLASLRQYVYEWGGGGGIANRREPGCAPWGATPL